VDAKKRLTRLNKKKVIDVSGEWNGKSLMDGAGNERENDSAYVLVITQSENNLSATLKIPPDTTVTSPIQLTGKSEIDSTISLQGTGTNSYIQVTGKLESSVAMHLIISGLEKEVQLIYMTKKETPLEAIAYDNQYKLELKFGVAGVGRSTILIHGMNDNAESWDEMISYFKYNAIKTTDKGVGTMTLLSSPKDDITFKVTSTDQNPQIEGTAVGAVTAYSIMGTPATLSITIKSTTLPGVNMFKIEGNSQIVPLNVSVNVLYTRNSFNVTLLDGESTVGNVWVYEYKWWEHIDVNAQELFIVLPGLQKEGKISDEPILVAHSMGGLVSRSYIARGGNFSKLVTLGTPHLGSNLGHFVPYGDKDGIGDLIPGHTFLTNLNSNTYEKSQRSKYWLLNGRAGTYPSCYVGKVPTCYHWHSPEPTAVEKAGYAALSKPNDGMVPEYSSRFSGNNIYDGDNSVHRIDSISGLIINN